MFNNNEKYTHHHNEELYSDESDENHEQDFQDKEKSITDISSISSYSQSIIDYINQKGWKYLSTSDLSDLDSIESLQFQDESAHDVVKVGKTNAIKENQNYELYENEFEDKSDKKNSFLLADDETHASQNNILHKSKLFQKCLSELAQELEVYQQENEMLRMKQQKVKEEYKKVKDLYAHLKAEKDIVQCEKEELAQEKKSFKSKLKETYQKVYEKLVEKNKQDHQKINVVKNELEKLKDTFLQKESEWSVINGRQKSQIRVLQIENSKLKQELKESQENNVKCKKLNTNSNAKGLQPSNCEKNPVKNKMNAQNTKIDMNCGTSRETDQEKLYKEELKRKNHLITAESIVRKRNLYESLMRDAVKNFPSDQAEKKMNEGHLQNKNNKQEEVKEIQHSDGRVEYHHSNGNIKIIFPNEGKTKMIYYNGDIQESDNDGTVKYFYAESKTLHITMPDGLEIFEFPDGQVEQRLTNGTTEIAFPDGSVKILQLDGVEKWILEDGTSIQTSPDGEKVLTFLNGQKEIHTQEYKRQEFPDGTVKILYPEGIQETHYINGRISIKDKYGNLMMDTHLPISAVGMEYQNK